MCMVVSFLGVPLKSKHLKENEEKLSFCKIVLLYFENILNGQSLYGLKHVIITFYLTHIFRIENVVNYFCFEKNRYLLSTK